MDSTVIIGGLLSIVGALIIYNLGCISKKLSAINIRLDQQDGRITTVEKFGGKLADCQVECSRTNVSKEDWVRSEALTRQKLDAVAETMAKINGKLEIVQQLPDIAGRIAREVANALKSGGE
jgi:predicted methyltransferase